jgi:hypothetical protein
MDMRRLRVRRSEVRENQVSELGWLSVDTLTDALVSAHDDWREHVTNQGRDKFLETSPLDKEIGLTHQADKLGGKRASALRLGVSETCFSISIVAHRGHCPSALMLWLRLASCVYSEFAQH